MRRSMLRPIRLVNRGLALAIAVLLLPGGCSDKPQQGAQADKAAASQSADQPRQPSNIDNQTSLVSAPPQVVDDPAVQVLRRMGQAYLDLNTYSDHARGLLRYTIDGHETKNEYPLEVTFQRPNKLRLTAYEGQIVCDGEHIYATYDELPGYLIQTTAPPQLSLADVYSDAFMQFMLTQREVGAALQLSLLLNDGAVDEILASGSAPPKLLEPRKLGDRMCDVVEVPMDDGAMLLWVDQQTSALRRIEYPTGGLKQSLAQHGQVTDAAVQVDFNDVSINGTVDAQAFAFQPGDRKLVKQFMPPLPPLLGKAMPSFTFTSLDGKEITPESLKGKIVVLDFWATWCQPCLRSMPVMAQVQERFKDNDRVQFLAVSIDEASVKDKDIAEKLKPLAPEMPIARDLQQFAFSAFEITGIPNTVLIDADGVVQDNEMGLNPNVDPVEYLSGKIDALLKGESLYQRRFEEFEKSMMQDPPAATAAAPVPATDAQAAAKSEPAHHRLTKLWTAADMVDPGNILVIPGENGASKILAIDGWQAVVELDDQGRIAARHDLELPNQGVAAFLRTAVDGQGNRYYLASAIGVQQVHLYDANFKRLLSYPEVTDHPGIFDALLADVDGDGQLEIVVSYFDVVGVQLVNLQGERQWSERSIRDVFRVAVTDPVNGKARDILAAHAQGTIARLNAKGERGDEIRLPQAFRSLTTAPLAPGGRLEYAGMAFTPEGGEAFVSFTLQGDAKFVYPMPRGTQHPSLEQATWGKLVGDQPHWVVAGPDGSVHFIATDGQTLDRFNYGEIVNGIGATTLGDKPVLLISSKNGLEAWQVEKK